MDFTDANPISACQLILIIMQLTVLENVLLKFGVFFFSIWFADQMERYARATHIWYKVLIGKKVP